MLVDHLAAIMSYISTGNAASQCSLKSFHISQDVTNKCKGHSMFPFYHFWKIWCTFKKINKHSLVYPRHALSRKPSLHTAHTEFTVVKGSKIECAPFQETVPPYKKWELDRRNRQKGCRVSIRPVCSSLVVFFCAVSRNCKLRGQHSCVHYVETNFITHYNWHATAKKIKAQIKTTTGSRNDGTQPGWHV